MFWSNTLHLSIEQFYLDLVESVSHSKALLYFGYVLIESPLAVGHVFKSAVSGGTDFLN